MKRLWALCSFGLVAAGCNLDFGQNDQPNDGDADLPGEEYRQCVLGTLQQCDDQDLTPDACTALIFEQCNDGGCDPMDPTGQCPPPCDDGTDPMGCPPPPPDCFQQVFDDCVAQGIDPMECAVLADQVCNPQCQPGDPNCEPCPIDTMNPDGSCPPPPDDCWTLAFDECLSWGLPQDECFAYADQVCYPPPCDPTTDPWCECQDPMDPNCWPCQDPMDPTCWPPPPPCQDPSDPNCEPPPPPCPDPMDPTCWPPPDCQPGDPNCAP